MPERDANQLAADDVARRFHEAYERLAPEHGYKTRGESAVPWDDVPEPNKSLMVAVAAEVHAELVALVGTLQQRVADLTEMCAAHTQNEMELVAQVGTLQQERDEWHRIADDNLDRVRQGDLRADAAEAALADTGGDTA